MSNHLKPCPFCGGDASFNDHTDGCYFTVLRKLKADPPADLSRVPDLIEAWNTRTAIQQAESEPVEISPEFTDTARAALLWVLWHHQGGSSPVGQPIRYAIGMGAHDHLNDHQVIEAKRWASITGAQTSEFHTHPAPGVPDDVVRNAERYLWLRSTTNWASSNGERIDVRNNPELWDSAIDAAMLAASPAQKGKP